MCAGRTSALESAAPPGARQKVSGFPAFRVSSDDVILRSRNNIGHVLINGDKHFVPFGRSGKLVCARSRMASNTSLARDGGVIVKFPHERSAALGAISRESQ